MRESQTLRRNGKYLDKEVKMAEVVVAAGRSVATHDFFAIYFRRDSYMLANGEAEHVILVWKSKAIAMVCPSAWGRINTRKEARTSQCLEKQLSSL